MKRCLLCSSPAVEPVIDFGRQPLCNRFLATPTDAEATFPLALGVCGACGVVQLLDPQPAADLKPRVDWITCNEPEGHLDDLAIDILRLPGLQPTASSLCGVSFKDDSLLQRLQKHGCTRTRRLDPQTDLGIHDPCAGIETIQASLTPERAAAWVARYGPADVVIARHVFEHASDPRVFAAALKTLLAPGGHLIIEIPDCEKALTVRDYTTVWEEHTLYLTPHTFHGGMESLGFAIQETRCIPYILENSLIAVMQVAHEPAPRAATPEATDREITRARLFAAAFSDRREAITNQLESRRRQQGRIAIFGAGHLACTFVNLFGVGGLIDCVIDDNPRKVGLFMPGSRLPILNSAALEDRDIALCLLSIGVGGERTVIDKHAGFVAAGGEFRSIFPASSLAIRP